MKWERGRTLEKTYMDRYKMKIQEFILDLGPNRSGKWKCRGSQCFPSGNVGDPHISLLETYGGPHFIEAKKENALILSISEKNGFIYIIDRSKRGWTCTIDLGLSGTYFRG